MKKIILVAGSLFFISSGAFAASGDYVCYFSGFVDDPNAVNTAVQSFLNVTCDKTKPFSLSMASDQRTGTEVCCVQK